MDDGPSTMDGLHPWRVMLGGAHSAFHQMALDEQLARDPAPRVRFFTWSAPAVSLGWKQPVPAWLDGDAWRAAGLERVERPTGGGMAFHGSDLSVSVIVPRSVRLPVAMLMRTACESAVRLGQELGVGAAARLESGTESRIDYCLMEPSAYAVMVGARKVAGFALRRYPDTWLIQGSMLVRPLPLRLACRLPDTVAGRLAARAVSLSEAAKSHLAPAALAERWAQCWSSWWEAQLVVELSAADAV
ncbi:MAG: hypothetical protein HY599_02165 [Candidatus Omnitrophica bacterium]|nr:hypothetical protein [Candidatus Omnitrophota bacterium]